MDLRDFSGFREGVTLLLLAVTVVVSTILNHNFIGEVNLSFILTNSVELGLMALVMTMLMIMGEIDLSIGSTMGLSAAVLGQLITAGVPFVPAAICALVAAVLAGIVNGVLCVVLRLSSLVVTLTTFVLFRGLAQLIVGSNTVSDFPSWFVSWDLSRAFWFISYPVLFWCFAILVAMLVLHRLRLGRQIFLIGGNALAARYAGLRVNRTRIYLLGASGLFAGIATMLFTSRSGSLDNTTGNGMELVVITAVLLGGTDFRGGRGKILGTSMAVLLISALQNGLQLGGISAQVTTAIVGGLLILCIALTTGLVAFGRRARRPADPDRSSPAESVTATVP